MDRKWTVQDVECLRDIAEYLSVRFGSSDAWPNLVMSAADRIEAAMGGDTALAERVLDLLADTYIGRDGAAYAEARALITAQQAKGECHG